MLYELIKSVLPDATNVPSTFSFSAEGVKIEDQASARHLKLADGALVHGWQDDIYKNNAIVFLVPAAIELKVKVGVLARNKCACSFCALSLRPSTTDTVLTSSLVLSLRAMDDGLTSRTWFEPPIELAGLGSDRSSADRRVVPSC